MAARGKPGPRLPATKLPHLQKKQLQRGKAPATPPRPPKPPRTGRPAP